jgi:hypothetical protein
MSSWPFDHNERWNINYTTEEQFAQFRFRLNKPMQETPMFLFSDTQLDIFHFLMGRSVVPKSRHTKLSKILDTAKTLPDYATKLQAIFETCKRVGHPDDTDRLYKVIEICLSYTPQVGIAIKKVDSEVIIYPSGAELLDSNVVNSTLSWLSDYPDVLKSFSTALELYMEGDESRQRNLLDNLRLSIEQLLKEVLGNNKSLENQQRELGIWLKAKGVHQQVTNLYSQLLFGPFRIYQNETVKHAGEYREQDVEFMIYLSGTFMRLLLQLQRG